MTDAREVQALKVLQAARKLIEKRENWCKFSFARNKDGKETAPELKDAYSFCINGVFRAVGTLKETMVARDRLKMDMRNIRPEFPWELLSAFNDSEGTTHNHILALFDAAIAKVEANIKGEEK